MSNFWGAVHNGKDFSKSPVQIGEETFLFPGINAGSEIRDLMGDPRINAGSGDLMRKSGDFRP